MILIRLLTRFSFSLIGFLILTTCTTNTAIDAIFHPWEWQSASRDTPETNALCRSLRNMGYSFDLFDVYDVYVRVFYPDMREESYYLFTGVGLRAVTQIHRVYSGENAVTNAELERLLPEARQLCQDIQRNAAKLSWVKVDVLFVLLDPESGVTILYESRIPTDCATLDWRSVFVGSQSNRDQFEAFDCQ